MEISTDNAKELDNYKIFFDKLKNDNHFYRLGKLFCTSSQKYFYDAGTGKVFQINDELYTVLLSIFENDSFDGVYGLDMDISILCSVLKEIKESVEKEKILSAPPVTCFKGPQSYSLEENLQQNLTQLTLEVTERCNLRCAYCIYQNSHNDYRNFSKEDMTFETAKKAIDFVYPRINDTFFLAFYGGEPLLKFDLIKQCVEYAENLVKDKKLSFSITTNAVLITKEIAQYLVAHGFVVLVSLDGPEEIHDENRKFPDGTGSFRHTMLGFKNLADAYKGIEGKIYISMVTTGSNYNKKYDEIQSFFDGIDWLPESLAVNVSNASRGRFPVKYFEPSIQNENEYRKDKIIAPIFDWSVNKQNSSYNKEKLFSNNQMQRFLHVIHRRDLSYTPMEDYYFNACCIPGSRRLHVNVKGDFMPCERVGTVPYLGNVEIGFDMAQIRKYYVEDFMKESIKCCKNCWAIHMCTSCYVNCFDNDKVNMSYRHDTCVYIRHIFEKSLSLYHEILENDPESLEPLNDIVMV